MRIDEHFDKPTVSVCGSAPVRRVALAMRDHGVGSVVVVDEQNKALGIITDRDLMERVVAARRDPDDTATIEVMSQPLVHADPHHTVDGALAKMADAGVRRMPVLADRWCTGLVSIDDAVDDLAEDLHELAGAARRRISHSRRSERLNRALLALEEGVHGAVGAVGDAGLRINASVRRALHEVRGWIDGKAESEKDPPSS